MSGATFPSAARLKWGLPLQLVDVAIDFPDLKMIIVHLGHTWETDAIMPIRRCANVHMDISAVHYRPLRYWQAMITAIKYGVQHNILPGSDFPSATMDKVIAGLSNVNSIVEGMQFPRVPAEVQHMILHQNWKPFFPKWADESARA